MKVKSARAILIGFLMTTVAVVWNCASSDDEEDSQLDVSQEESQQQEQGEEEEDEGYAEEESSEEGDETAEVEDAVSESGDEVASEDITPPGEENQLQNELDEVAAAVGASIDESGGDSTGLPAESGFDQAATTPDAGIAQADDGVDNYSADVPESNVQTSSPSGDSVPYVVRPGDSLSKIAKKVYGDLNKWQQLASFNNISNPDLIFVGQQINLFTEGMVQDFAGQMETLESVTVVVEPGDTLSDIAEREIGFADAWKYIYYQNQSKIKNPNMIYTGQSLQFRQILEFSH